VILDPAADELLPVTTVGSSTIYLSTLRRQRSRKSGSKRYPILSPWALCRRVDFNTIGTVTVMARTHAPALHSKCLRGYSDPSSLTFSLRRFESRLADLLRISSFRRQTVVTGIPDYAPRSKVWLAYSAFTFSLQPPDDDGTSVRSLPLDPYRSDCLTHRSSSASLKPGQAPRLYGAFQSDYNASPDESSDTSSPPNTPLLAARDPSPTRPSVPTPHPTDGPFKNRTTMVFSRRLALCLAVVLLQSVLTVCVLARYINLDSTAHRASKEKSAIIVEREKLEGERQMWKLERGEWETDKGMWELERGKWEADMGRWEADKGKWEADKGKWEADKGKWEADKEMWELEREMWEREKGEWEWERGEWEREKGEWECERGEWEQKRGKWEREKGEWKSEREKLNLEREKLRLERKKWEKARDDRVPQDAFWEDISPAVVCHAYGKREYSGVLQNISEDWTAMDACMHMPVEIEGVPIKRPDRCGFVEGSPHVHGYWMVDWDQPDCEPYFKEFHDTVSPTSPPSLSVRYWHAHTSQGCIEYQSGQRRIEAHLVGINDKKGQDWWLLCSTTPMVWNETTYTSPTHCEERVSCFPFESFAGEADPYPR